MDLGTGSGSWIRYACFEKRNQIQDFEKMRIHMDPEFWEEEQIVIEFLKIWLQTFYMIFPGFKNKNKK